MNKERRKKIELIRQQIWNLRDDVEVLRNEEQDYYDNMPESFQNGGRGETVAIAIDELDSAVFSLERAVQSLDASIE